MVKESYEQGTEHEMIKRIMNFVKAKNNPTKKIGKDRVRGIREGYVRAPSPKSVKRFEQLNKEDSWSKVKYEGTAQGLLSPGGASITVKDHKDTFDVVLPNISEE